MEIDDESFLSTVSNLDDTEVSTFDDSPQNSDTFLVKRLQARISDLEQQLSLSQEEVEKAEERYLSLLESRATESQSSNMTSHKDDEVTESSFEKYLIKLKPQFSKLLLTKEEYSTLRDDPSASLSFVDWMKCAVYDCVQDELANMELKTKREQEKKEKERMEDETATVSKQKEYIQQIEKGIKQEKERVEKLKTKCGELFEENDSLHMQLNEAEKKAEVNSEESKRKDEEIKRMRIEAKEKETERAEIFKRKKDEWEEEICKCRQALQQKDEEIIQLKTEKSSLNKTISSLHNELRQNGTHSLSIVSQLTQQTEQIAKLTMDLASAKAQLQVCEVECNKEKEKASILSREVSRLKGKGSDDERNERMGEEKDARKEAASQGKAESERMKDKKMMFSEAALSTSQADIAHLLIIITELKEKGKEKDRLLFALEDENKKLRDELEVTLKRNEEIKQQLQRTSPVEGSSYQSAVLDSEKNSIAPVFRSTSNIASSSTSEPSLVSLLKEKDERIAILTKSLDDVQQRERVLSYDNQSLTKAQNQLKQRIKQLTKQIKDNEQEIEEVEERYKKEICSVKKKFDDVSSKEAQLKEMFEKLMEIQRQLPKK